MSPLNYVEKLCVLTDMVDSPAAQVKEAPAHGEKRIGRVDLVGSIVKKSFVAALSQDTLGDSWLAVWARKWNRSLASKIDIIGTLCALVYLYQAFLRWNESRTDIQGFALLHDPVLRQLTPSDFSLPLFFLVYGAVILALGVYGRNKPDLVMELLQAKTCVIYMRMPAFYKHHKADRLIAREATDWLSIRRFKTSSACITALRESGYDIWTTELSQEAVSLEAPELKLPDRVAIVMGREADGVSQEMIAAADKRVYLPIHGFADSLNLNVATGLIIQRLFFICPEARGAMTKTERSELREDWYHRMVKGDEKAETFLANPPPAYADLRHEDLIANFQQLLEKRKVTEAMQIFQSLKKPPTTALSQRLAIMLAKRATLKDTKDAINVLKSVYMYDILTLWLRTLTKSLVLVALTLHDIRNPALRPDDITKLAFIFVSDACYRNKMIKEALEVCCRTSDTHTTKSDPIVQVTEEAHNLGMRLDLPAYNNLINALVDAGQTDEAILILQDIAAGSSHRLFPAAFTFLLGDVISPDETTYAGLVNAIMSQREFSQAVETINQARTSGVKFSGEVRRLHDEGILSNSITQTYMSFMATLADVEDDSDALDRLLSYLETSMDEDGVEAFEEFENAMLSHDEDDDDDDDDGEGDNLDEDTDDSGNALH
ncbi:hypothetical protein DYB32_001393 [Aphanomyces invadans]|uniref:tRNA/rRNA methyltransferase SpoU type domain-containing protein n=1 Tax=Aphanomyces invadans TaxID=157072 RepID=A0A3R7D5S0_9STRA|nr:hypothetical protein DYB32_001393 [Aphanomyces invadans]